jgi:hypothetical protein
VLNNDEESDIMDEKDSKKVELIAEVTVQRFFTHYLEEVFPEQLAAMISAHNKDVTAHAQQIQIAVRAESSRVKLWLISLIFAGGIGGGVGIAKAVTFFAGN